jgi:hypothetical protein
VQDQDSRGTRVNKILCRAPPAWAAETEVIALRRESQGCPRSSWDSLISTIVIERPLASHDLLSEHYVFHLFFPHFPLQANSCFANFFCLYIFQKTFVHSVHSKRSTSLWLDHYTVLSFPLSDSQATITAAWKMYLLCKLKNSRAASNMHNVFQKERDVYGERPFYYQRGCKEEE